MESSAFAPRMCLVTEVRDTVFRCRSASDSVSDLVAGTGGWDSHVLVALRSTPRRLREAPRLRSFVRRVSRDSRGLRVDNLVKW